MFEKFTDRARQVLTWAEEEAKALDHNYVGTEHILLGLIREGDGIAAKAIETRGVTQEAVRWTVEDMIGHGQQAPPARLPFTPRAKRVLELALAEALRLGDKFIGTEHVLLGLLRETDGVAVQALVRLGADVEQLRQQVIALRRSKA